MTGQSASSSPLALPQKYRATPKQPEDADQAIVHTPYGRGLVTRTRKDDAIKEIQLLEWESLVKPTSASGTKRQTPFMMYTAVDYPSVIPRIGDDVICQYGRGRVTSMSRVTTTTDTITDAETKKDTTTTTTTKPAIKIKYTIALSSWRLNGRSDVTCNVIYPPPRVVRKHTLSEMDAHEKVSLAKTQKAKATTFFSQKKDYDLALTTYASAVDAVRNVQHDHTSTNTVRADLVVVMVTCSNNAATCCIKLQKYDEASKFAKNALILLDALYGKRGKKIHTILKSEGSIDAKLFGEWRMKSYLIVARSCIETNEIVDAMAVLKKARGVATSYMEEINANQQQQSRQSKEEKASLKSLTIQMKEIRRLLVECSEKKKAAKKMEKRRAKAMFGGGGSSSKEGDGDKENASTAETNANNKDLEQQQSDKKESSATTKNANTANTPDTVVDEVRHTESETKKPPPLKRKSSLNGNKDGRPGPRKSVSFSNRPPQIKEIESANNGDGEDAPWYSEHQEALIMLAVAGLSAAALMALRRSAR